MDSQAECLRLSNVWRAINLARGRFRLAMQNLGSQGCASYNNSDALADLLGQHPVSDLPPWSDSTPPPLVVESVAVLAALWAFPKATSPGAPKLCAQHILDAVSGTIAPAAQTCLEHLTRLMNKLLGGAIDPQVAPWLSRAPLTSLIKKTGVYRPIHLVSKLRYAAVKSQLLISSYLMDKLKLV